MAVTERRKREKPEDVAKQYLYHDPDWVEERYINKEKGRGVFAVKTILQGDFIVTYRGVFALKEDLKEQEEHYEKNDLGSFVFDFSFNGREFCIDATKEDNSLGRLINDSKYFPNAIVKQIKHHGFPFLCLFSNRNISAGEEIVYFYGENNLPWHGEEKSIYIDLIRKKKNQQVDDHQQVNNDDKSYFGYAVHDDVTSVECLADGRIRRMMNANDFQDDSDGKTENTVIFGSSSIKFSSSKSGLSPSNGVPSNENVLSPGENGLSSNKNHLILGILQGHPNKKSIKKEKRKKKRTLRQRNAERLHSQHSVKLIYREWIFLQLEYA